MSIGDLSRAGNPPVCAFTVPDKARVIRMMNSFLIIDKLVTKITVLVF
jgi:hypothetical protein